MNPKKYRETSIPLKEFLPNLTPAEREYVETEKKYMHIVMSLVQLRKTLGLTQAELAKKSRLPRTTISKVESGSRNTTLQTLMMLAQAMGKKVELKLT